MMGDFIQAYAVMALLMMAYAAWADPFPRMYGLAYDITLYVLMGLLWPIVWIACLLIYFNMRNQR